jgi:hypothetical protein
VYDDMAVQLVAYAKGQYWLDDFGVEHDWPPPSAAVIVHLGPKGFRLYRAPLQKAVWRVFLAALDIRRWQQDGPRLEELGPAEADWNRVWRDEQIAKLRARTVALSVEQQLELSGLFHGQGLPTKLSLLDGDELSAAVAMADAYVLGVPAADRETRVMRPMP